MTSTFVESIALEQVSPGHFMTTHHPESNSGATGNTIAYGGTTLAVGVKAAFATVKDDYHLYSATGYFMGPTLTTAPLEVHVTALRDTRTFATRQISISQRQGTANEPRVVIHMLADFHVAEGSSLLEYDSKPEIKYSSWDTSYTTDQVKQHAAAKSGGRLPKALEKVFDSGFLSTRKYFDARAVPEAIGAQTMAGFLPQLPTTQDQLPITSKTTANYFKARHALDHESNNLAALAYILDAGSAAVPPVFARVNLAEVGAAASLDFAIRVFKPTVNMEEWHLREDKTIQASHARSYQEARMWDPNGNMVASMTQQCILRPKSKAPKL